MAYPDTEQMLVGWLAGFLPAVRVLTNPPVDLLPVLPLVQLVRFGGSDSLPGIDVVHIDVDTYAVTRKDASNLAENVRYALRFVLAGQQVDGLTVCRVDTIVGPAWRPYENPLLSRFGASYSLTLHAKTIREVTP